MVIQGNKGIFDPVSALSSKRASPYPIFSIPHPPIFQPPPLAHTPSNLTSPAPEPPLKYPIYRSIFCLMRITSKPANPYDADTIYQRVTSKVQPGSIVLFHNAALHTPEALPRILEYLINEGYTVLPISQLILTGDYTIDHTGRQFAASSGQ